MTLSYFDSSFLLAILLDEERQEEAYAYWQNSTRVSSILLRIETIIVLRRTYEINKQKLESNWLNKKTKVLNNYLDAVNYKVISSKTEREIYSRNELTRCRSLDAIHIATALQFRELNNGEEVNLYTYDRTMHGLAEYYSFKTNEL